MAMFAKKAAIFLFLVFLSAPGLLFLAGLDTFDARKFAEREVRLPHPMPEIAPNAASLREFPDQFELFFNDRVGLRTQYTALWRTLLYRIFNASLHRDSVVAGKNGWLFLGDRFADVFSRHAGQTRHNPALPERLANYHKRIQEEFALRDAHFLILVAPDKHSVYPEYLPDYVKNPIPTPTYSEFLSKAAEKNLAAPDLRDCLADAKKTYGDLLYPRTNTHWTSLGAYLAYVAAMDYINTHCFPVATLPIAEHRLEETDTGFDLSRLLGVRTGDFTIDLAWSAPPATVTMLDQADNTTSFHNAKELRVADNAAVAVSNPAALNNAKVLVIRDSFFNAMAGFFVQSFRECTIYPRYSYTRKSIDFTSLKFDLVIYEVIERDLPFIEENLAALSGALADLP